MTSSSVIAEERSETSDVTPMDRGLHPATIIPHTTQSQTYFFCKDHALAVSHLYDIKRTNPGLNALYLLRLHPDKRMKHRPLYWYDKRFNQKSRRAQITSYQRLHKTVQRKQIGVL